MLIRGFERGRCLLARLDHGAEIISQITDLASKEKIETGICSAIGALSGAELAYYDQASREYRRITITDPVELASCLGNISLLNGRPFVHVHAVLSSEDGRVWAGHLISGTIFAAEIHIEELLGMHLHRTPDSITGLNLWGEE